MSWKRTNIASYVNQNEGCTPCKGLDKLKDLLIMQTSSFANHTDLRFSNLEKTISMHANMINNIFETNKNNSEYYHNNNDSNIIIGKNAKIMADGSSHHNSNQIVIGTNAVGNGHNSITLGNYDIESIHCQAQTISSPSDIRTKKNIVNSKLGLDFIDKLCPVRYNRVNPADYPDEIKDVKYNNRLERPCDDNTLYDGLIAQDVKKALDDLGEDWDGHYVLNKKQGLKYGLLVMPLINAVKELKNKNDKLSSIVENQQILIDHLYKKMSLQKEIQ